MLLNTLNKICYNTYKLSLSSGFKPIKLFADPDNIRAWPGGVGNVKVGGNYGSTILPSREALTAHDCSQVLWLFGADHQITEVGAMNIFFVFKLPDGGKELITAPLTRGDILPGVTRSSVLELAKGLTGEEKLTVSERWITMKEVMQAEEDGRLLESFGAGTAVVVAPVKSIMYLGKEIKCISEAGPVAKLMLQRLADIQYGRVESPWSIPC